MNDHPNLEALPGRVILRFDPPEARAGRIIAPDGSKRRSEVGEVIGIGWPVNFSQFLVWLRVKIGDRLPVTYGAGVQWYFGTDEKFSDFNHVRAFSIGEIATKIKGEK